MKSSLNRLKPLLAAILLSLFLLPAGCAEDYLSISEEDANLLSMTDFIGEWQSTLPNGEKWRLILHEDGRFESLPVRSNRGRIDGRWKVKGGKFFWEYGGEQNTGGSTSEINPIIMKIENKFMLQERMGMKSVYSRKQ